MNTETIEVTMKLRKVESIRELQIQNGERWDRRIGLIYFQQVEGGFITRVVSERTNGPWLLDQIFKKLIYVQEERTTAEPG